MQCGRAWSAGLAASRASIAGVGSAGGQRQTGAQGVGAVRFLQVFTAEQLLCLVVAAELHQDIDGIELDGLIFRLGAAGFNQLGQRFFKLTGCDQCSGFFAQVATDGRQRAKRSRKARISLSGRAPVNSSTSWPWKSTLTDGMLRTRSVGRFPGFRRR